MEDKRLDENLEEDLIETDNEDIETEETDLEEDLEEETEEEIDLIKELEKENEELQDRLIRLQAEFSNYKKRMERNREDMNDYLINDMIGDLIPIIDNFERALDSEEDTDNGFYKGVQMIFKELIGLIENMGAEEIEALDCNFDPAYHQAVTMEDGEEANKILEVYQKGYMRNKKVIRPSMVKVSK